MMQRVPQALGPRALLLSEYCVMKDACSVLVTVVCVCVCVWVGGKRGPELDDDELMSLSKRLVEDAVSRAVQQYMEETQQNGSTPKDEAPPNTTPK